jgi:prepilin-type N-terminal cleavage/methylation domain-containing protein
MRDSRGFTLVELLIVMAIVAVLLSISFAVYRHVRARGNEVSAIAALEAINQAQFAYMQTCGNQRYAPTLADLGKPHPVTGVPYLSPDLTAEGEQVVKSGYVLRMGGTLAVDEPRTCTGATPVSSYYVTADPTVPGVTGMRSFATNTDRAIYEDVETFYAEMPETGPPEHGRELNPKS